MKVDHDLVCARACTCVRVHVHVRVRVRVRVRVCARAWLYHLILRWAFFTFFVILITECRRSR